MHAGPENLAMPATTGKFTGFSKGRLADPSKTHESACSRSSSLPSCSRLRKRTGSATESESAAPENDEQEVPFENLPCPFRRNTSFSLGESPVEASVAKHSNVELVDNCKGSTVYALNQNFGIVRHADRLDRTPEWVEHPDKEEWPNDTPLSRAGHEHATQTGKAIKESGKKFELIISSPYLRCAQTSCRIAQVLKCPIQFDLDLGEVFDGSSMVGKVTGPQHRSADELEALLKPDFPDVVWMRGKNRKIQIEGKQQKWPECLDTARMRFCFKVKQSLQVAASRLVSILVVTHGDAVGAVLGMMKKRLEDKTCALCSLWACPSSGGCVRERSG